MSCCGLFLFASRRRVPLYHWVRRGWFWTAYRWLVGAWLATVLAASTGWAIEGYPSASRLRQLAGNGCVMLNDEQGQPLLVHHSESVMVPASIIKIHTALATLHLLGPEYRFRTDFRLDPHGYLVIKGWGDPFLLSNEIRRIADSIKALGHTRFKGLQLDTTAFAENISIPGLSGSKNPYDAINGALIVNFNTVNVGRNKNGAIHSAEPETPLTALAVGKAQDLPNGSQQRISFSGSRRESLQYVTELFTAVFEEKGIEITSPSWAETTTDPSWPLIYRHHSSVPLETILSGLQQYSNNTIANQLFLVTGAEILGYPATLAKSRQVFQSFFRDRFDPLLPDGWLDEASGISRCNRMTGQWMIAILEAFRPHSGLLPKRNGILVKSGTLTGVYNYAGYFITPDGLRPFVILLNQPDNTRDTLLELLAAYSRQIRR
jgi:serine-type D-Ala-D-Ala carboxypeptidase/endopeptidase (penicillin-binding protein 4)